MGISPAKKDWKLEGSSLLPKEDDKSLPSASGSTGSLAPGDQGNGTATLEPGQRTPSAGILEDGKEKEEKGEKGKGKATTRGLALASGLLAFLGVGSTNALPRPLREGALFPKQCTDNDAGGRALSAVIRPYAMKVAGIPTVQEFNLQSRRFVFAFKNNDWIPDSEEKATEIYLPHFHVGSSMAK